MKNTYMVEFDLPETFDEQFMQLIPKQRYVVHQMLAEGVLKSYALSMDRGTLWAIMLGTSEFDVLETVSRMPLSPYMTPYVSELMFHNSADTLMHFSLN